MTRVNTVTGFSVNFFELRPGTIPLDHWELGNDGDIRFPHSNDWRLDARDDHDVKSSRNPRSPFACFRRSNQQNVQTLRLDLPGVTAQHRHFTEGVLPCAQQLSCYLIH